MGTKEKRIVLDSQDFEHLVRGGELQSDGVRIILSDLGYKLMIKQMLAVCEDGETRLGQVRTKPNIR